MLKKTLIGVGVVLVAGAAIFGSDIFSYAGTACSNIQQAVKSEITPEFELSRIRNEIDKHNTDTNESLLQHFSTF